MRVMFRILLHRKDTRMRVVLRTDGNKLYFTVDLKFYLYVLVNTYTAIHLFRHLQRNQPFLDLNQ